MKDILKEYYCRRDGERARFEPASVLCWTDGYRPSEINAIEVDGRGARVLLPWDSQEGEFVCVSLADELGQFQTRSAVVVWTRPLQNSTKVIAGLAFAA